MWARSDVPNQMQLKQRLTCPLRHSFLISPPPWPTRLILGIVDCAMQPKCYPSERRSHNPRPGVKHAPHPGRSLSTTVAVPPDVNHQQTTQ